jgi:hypothetical protein
VPQKPLIGINLTREYALNQHYENVVRECMNNVGKKEHSNKTGPRRVDSPLFHDNSFNLTKAPSGKRGPAEKIKKQNALLTKRVENAKPRINTGLHKKQPVQTEENTKSYFNNPDPLSQLRETLAGKTYKAAPNSHQQFVDKLPPIQLYK